MKTQLELHGNTRALRRALNRAAAAPQAHVERRSPRRRLRALPSTGEQGQAMVEFALILPAMLLIATGIMIFGYTMNNYLMLTNAVSVGARQVSLYGHNAGATLGTSDPCAVASSAIIAAAPGLNPSALTFSFSFNGVPASSTSCTGAAGNLLSGTNVTVSATYPFTLSVYAQVFSKSNAVLEATSTELIQ